MGVTPVPSRAVSFRSCQHEKGRTDRPAEPGAQPLGEGAESERGRREVTARQAGGEALRSQNLRALQITAGTGIQDTHTQSPLADRHQIRLSLLRDNQEIRLRQIKAPGTGIGCLPTQSPSGSPSQAQPPPRRAPLAAAEGREATVEDRGRTSETAARQGKERGQT